jgi:hypothetical protein
LRNGRPIVADRIAVLRVAGRTRSLCGFVAGCVHYSWRYCSQARPQVAIGRAVSRRSSPVWSAIRKLATEWQRIRACELEFPKPGGSTDDYCRYPRWARANACGMQIGRVRCHKFESFPGSQIHRTIQTNSLTAHVNEINQIADIVKRKNGSPKTMVSNYLSAI